MGGGLLLPDRGQAVGRCVSEGFIDRQGVRRCLRGESESEEIGEVDWEERQKERNETDQPAKRTKVKGDRERWMIAIEVEKGISF